MVATASTLDENAGQGPRGRLGSSRELKGAGREEPRAHRTFFRIRGKGPASIRERNDQFVSDRFDRVGGEGELRGELIRLPRLECPRTFAVFARNGDLFSVYQA